MCLILLRGANISLFFSHVFLHVRCDPFTDMTCLILMCATNLMCLIHLCGAKVSFFFFCTCRIYVCDVTHSHVYDMPHSQVWRYRFKFVTRLTCILVFRILQDELERQTESERKSVCVCVCTRASCRRD